jgi:dihydroneopterin aldolase
MPCQIEIEWEIPLTVGCTEEERSAEQAVSLTLRLHSPGGFRAASTDALSDTLDVEALRTTLTSSAREARTFTLERLGFLLEAAMREAFPEPGLHWEVRIKKHHAGWTYVQTWTT